MTDDAPPKAETRKEYLARKQRERRAWLKAAGLPRPPSGPSGGKGTVAERVRRHRARKKIDDTD